MKIWAGVFAVVWLVVVPGVWGQVKEVGEQGVGPTPEMKKLFDSFAGDWDSSEVMERTALFPNGGERKGRTHIRLASGGAMLVMEGHSDGSAGPLSYIIVIWWDEAVQRYGFFTCFKDSGSGCQVRGTAHWEGDKFVNDYEEVVHGKKVQMRDTFQDITPESYSLVFVVVKEDGATEKQIVTRAVRRLKKANGPAR